MVKQSNAYQKIINYMDHGRATSNERIVIKYEKYKYVINFTFSFSYDDSNGINIIKYEIKDATITNRDGGLKYAFDANTGYILYDHCEYTDEEKHNIEIYNKCLELVTTNFNYDD